MNLQSTSQTQTTHKTLEECIKESYSGLQNTIKEFQNGNIIQINNSHSHRYLQPLCYDDIHTLTKDSPPHLLKALYFCEDYTFLDSNRNPSLNESNIVQTFGYKSSFYLSFISHKDSLSNEYLEARKALYKTIMNLREQREQDYKEEQDRISQLSYEEYSQEQREKERQERLSSRNTINKDSHLILESNDKNNVIIFLDSANSLSNLIHIHNERIDIFTKDTSTIDIQEIINQYQSYGITLDSLHSSNTQIFLYSQLLLGSKEIESNPLFFGELDSKDNNLGLDTLKPIYHLIGETDYDTKDSKERFTQTLQVFLNSNTLTLLNYSIIDSSLNIKLECNSSESQAILEREKAQREQRDKDSQTQDSSPTAQNDKSQSTSMLHPILEDNEIKCPHNGVVQLKANKGKSFTSKGIPLASKDISFISKRHFIYF